MRPSSSYFINPLLSTIFGTTLFIATVATTLILPVLPANAQTVLFDNGLPDGDGGNISDVAGVQIGDNFRLSTTSTITEIQFWGGYELEDVPSTDDFSIGIYDFAGNTPNSTPNTTPRLFSHIGNISRTDTHTLAAGTEVFMYDLTGLDISLNSGTYLLSLQNNSLNLQTGGGWIWDRRALFGPSSFARDGTSLPWHTETFEFAFNARGTTVVVPEMGTLSLLLMTAIASLPIVGMIRH